MTSTTQEIIMEIRSILVNVGLGSQQTAVTYAAQLAQRFSAELVGIGAAEPSLAYAGIDNAQVAIDYFATERKNIETMLERAEEKFRAAVPATVPVRWRSYVANPTEMLIDQARRCDIIVAASDDISSLGETVDPGHLILASGRPVIMAREGGQTAQLDRIMVAWKDTREARRAISDALPFLNQAKQVNVLTHSEGDAATETRSLAEVVEWLGRHGVAAESRLVDQGVEFLDALGLLTLTETPDLIVAGGYGHSRFREWLFGGVTNDLLAARNISRLFSN
jgi:nucleotide-binding universal stress UspA family protein